MKIMLLLLLPVLWSAASADAEEQRSPTEQAFHLENFEGYEVGVFPRQWQARGDKNEARAIYRVAEEKGNRFLRASTEKQDIQIGLVHEFQPREFPALRWRWRVAHLPSGADERAKKTNDSAAGVYVIFDSRIMPRVLKYVWSSTVPVGTRITSPVYWRARVIVLQSGPSETNGWQQETVNFYQDYKSLFGFAPGKVQGIAVLTDSDATASVAEADYDDFALLPAGELADAHEHGVPAHLSSAAAKDE